MSEPKWQPTAHGAPPVEIVSMHGGRTDARLHLRTDRDYRGTFGPAGDQLERELREQFTPAPDPTKTERLARLKRELADVSKRVESAREAVSAKTAEIDDKRKALRSAAGPGLAKALVALDADLAAAREEMAAAEQERAALTPVVSEAVDDLAAGADATYVRARVGQALAEQEAAVVAEIAAALSPLLDKYAAIHLARRRAGGMRPSFVPAPTKPVFKAPAAGKPAPVELEADDDLGDDEPEADELPGHQSTPEERAAIRAGLLATLATKK